MKGRRDRVPRPGVGLCPFQLLARTQELEAQSLKILDKHQDRTAGRDRSLAARFPQRLPPPPQLLKLRLIQPQGSEYRDTRRTSLAGQRIWTTTFSVCIT